MLNVARIDLIEIVRRLLKLSYTAPKAARPPQALNHAIQIFPATWGLCMRLLLWHALKAATVLHHLLVVSKKRQCAAPSGDCTDLHGAGCPPCTIWTQPSQLDMERNEVAAWLGTSAKT
jgi:hypothetical protein